MQATGQTSAAPHASASVPDQVGLHQVAAPQSLTALNSQCLPHYEQLTIYLPYAPFPHTHTNTCMSQTGLEILDKDFLNSAPRAQLTAARKPLQQCSAWWMPGTECLAGTAKAARPHKTSTLQLGLKSTGQVTQRSPCKRKQATGLVSKRMQRCSPPKQFLLLHSKTIRHCPPTKPWQPWQQSRPSARAPQTGSQCPTAGSRPAPAASPAAGPPDPPATQCLTAAERSKRQAVTSHKNRSGVTGKVMGSAIRS